MDKHLTIINWFFLITLVCCSTPHDLVVLETKDKTDITWLNGREIKEVSLPKNTIRINFEESTNKEIVFHFLIEHENGNDILLNPVDIYICHGGWK